MLKTYVEIRGIQDFVHLSELCIGAKDFEPNVEIISIASEQEVRF